MSVCEGGWAVGTQREAEKNEEKQRGRQVASNKVEEVSRDQPRQERSLQIIFKSLDFHLEGNGVTIERFQRHLAGYFWQMVRLDEL